MISLSVIIPTYNRADRLRACLEALARQTQPPGDFEVIVVVDGSTDGTREMLASLSLPYALHVVWQENSGQCAALNHGAKVAHGRYCLFLDDDMIASPSLVVEHLRVQRAHPAVVGIGQITLTLPPEAGWFARCFAQGWRAHYAGLNQGIRSPSWDDCYGGNMSVPRAAFLAVGGFPIDLARNYDLDLAYRLKQHGLSFVYIPEAVCDQDERKCFRELAADAEKAGGAAVEICRRYPAALAQLLGAFCAVRLHELLPRRLLLALHMPPHLLAPIGPLLVKRTWIHAWYRVLHSYCYWRGVRRAVPDRDTWRRLTHSTPILMYHAFGADGEPPSRFVLPARRFARQMAWLRWMRYRVLSLEEFLRYRHEFRLPPARSIVITIDDGYADNRTLAHPILRRHGFPATIFLVSGKIGQINQWDSGSVLTSRPLLSWSEIQEMLRLGIQFGAHTRTHPVLTSLSSEQAQEEIRGSKAELECKLQVPIHVFAYPYGEYDSTTQAMTEQAGFWGSCSVDSGLNTPKTPLHALRRIEIWGTDSLVRFALMVLLGNIRRPVRSHDDSRP